MATIGLRDLYRAPITVGQDGSETYGTPVRMAKAISVELAVEVAEAILYADDGAGDFKKIVVPENPYGDIGSMNKDAGSYIDLEYEFHGLLKKYGCEGWFFGHDHENNASVTFEGVRYTYGLKSSEYDSFISSVLGGTRITLGESGLKVCHEFVSPDKF